MITISLKKTFDANAATFGLIKRSRRMKSFGIIVVQRNVSDHLRAFGRRNALHPERERQEPGVQLGGSLSPWRATRKTWRAHGRFLTGLADQAMSSL